VTTRESADYLDDVLRDTFGATEWDALDAPHQEAVGDYLAVVLADPEPFGFAGDLSPFGIVQQMARQLGRGGLAHHAEWCTTFAAMEDLRWEHAKRRDDERVSASRVMCLQTGCFRRHAAEPGDGGHAWDEAVRLCRWVPATVEATDLLCPDHRPEHWPFAADPLVGNVIGYVLKAEDSDLRDQAARTAAEPGDPVPGEAGEPVLYVPPAETGRVIEVRARPEERQG
jgi:hypothetical protein